MQSSHETLNVVEEKNQAEVGKDERVITEDMNGKELSPGSGPGEIRKVEPLAQKDSTSLSSESSSSSESEEEDVGEYRPHHRVAEGTIKEEQEECEAELEEEASRAAKVVERQEAVPEASAGKQAGASVSAVDTVTQETVVAPKIPTEKSVHEGAIKQDVSEEAEDEQHKVNGEVSHVDIDVLPQIICCSEVNGSLKRELNSGAISQVENTCLSSSPVLPVLLQLFQQDSDLDLSRDEGGKHCFVGFLPTWVLVASFFAAPGSPDRGNWCVTLTSFFHSRFTSKFSFACFGCFQLFVFSCTASSC